METAHRAIVAVVSDSTELLYSLGNPDVVTSLRSSAKPLQAVPLVTLGGAKSIQLSDEELAICCASHPGLPRHSALAASVLALSGFLPDNLVCGPPSGAASPLRHGCSGKHAGMLLTATLLGAALEGYHLEDHPVQKLISRLIMELSGADSLLTGIDGCSVPTFGLRIRDMARAFAALTRPGAAWERIPRVMGAYPELIGADDWVDVRVMQATRGRIIAKTGAEGLLCLGIPGQGLGMAVKMIDGGTRCMGAVALEALVQSGWLSEGEAAHPLLADHRHPNIMSPTGEYAAEVRLQPFRLSA